jgi:hypothetical protein
VALNIEPFLKILKKWFKLAVFKKKWLKLAVFAEKVVKNYFSHFFSLFNAVTA